MSDRAEVDDLGDRLERAIRDLLAARADGASICPSEAARRVAEDDWRRLMEPARSAAARLAAAGEVVITQGGVVVDAGRLRGPIRIRRARDPGEGRTSGADAPPGSDA